MTAYELLLAIKDYSEGDIRETIEQSNELLSDLMDNKLFIVKFSNEIEEFAINNNRCPNCGSELNQTKVGQEHSEYFGREVSENIYETTCTKCNYITN